MSYILTNALPILIATLASLLFGYAWTAAFGRPTAAASLPGSRSASLSAGFALGAFVAEFWLASILAGALILAPRQAGEWTMAIGSAVVIWIGFVLPALVVTLGYHRLGARRVFADCAHWLGAMVIQAAVLQAVGLTAPPGAS